MRWYCSILALLGRWCISVIFLISGISKFINYDNNLQYMLSKDINQMTPVLLVCAAILEVLCAISLIIGYKTRIGATILALYMIPLTLIFHNFWTLSEGAGRYIETIMFLKNLAIFGGLLYIIASGPGGCACDRWCGGGGGKVPEKSKPSKELS